MSYKLPKILGCGSSILCTILVAVLLSKDYSNISISDLSKDEKIFTGLILYSEINLGLTMIYVILSCIWSGMILCCNDEDNTTFQFSITKILFILSGVASTLYLFSKLIYSDKIIDDLITTSGWILVGNMFFIILTTIINKIYVLCCKNYNKLNNTYD